MTDKFITRSFKYIGHGGFLILFALSIVFFKERIVFIDNVFYLFKIIHFGKFNLEAGRYGAFISQIPLLIALKANLSLKGLILVYSASVVLIFYGVYFLCTHTLKNLASGLTIVFLFTLLMTKSFFHTAHESHQAFVYCALLFAVLQFPFSKKWLAIKHVSSICLIIICFYTYPVSSLVILFILFYHLIDTRKWKGVSVYLLILLVFALAIFKKYTTPDTSYEGAFLSELTNTSITWNVFMNYYSTQFFLNRKWGMFFWIIVVFFVLIAFLIWNRSYIKLAYIFISSLAFLILLLIIYNKGDSNIMMERCFLPLVPVISIPFFNEIPGKRKIYQIFIMLLATTIIIAGTLRINKEGRMFKKKYNNLSALIEKSRDLENSKFLLKRTDEHVYNIIIPWTFSFTTLVISSIDNKNASRTFFMYKDLSNYEKYLDGNENVFLGTSFWLEWDQRSFNKDYFNLSAESYVLYGE